MITEGIICIQWEYKEKKRKNQKKIIEVTMVENFPKLIIETKP